LKGKEFEISIIYDYIRIIRAVYLDYIFNICWYSIMLNIQKYCKFVIVNIFYINRFFLRNSFYNMLNEFLMKFLQSHQVTLFRFDKIVHRSYYLTAEISQSLHLETNVVSVINSTRQINKKSFEGKYIWLMSRSSILLFSF